MTGCPCCLSVPRCIDYVRRGGVIVICPQCHKDIADDSVFCDGCGFCVRPDAGNATAISASVDARPQDLFVVSDGRRPKKRTVKVATCVAIAAVALCVGVVGGFFAARAVLPGMFGLTFVNNVAFPDEMMRTAVEEQVDLDHNGILTEDETSAIVALEAYPQSITFLSAENVGDSNAQMTGVDPTPGNAPVWAGQENKQISLEGIGCFPNINTIVCGGVTIDHLDFTGIENLEFVDLQGSSVGSVELSQNANISTLFCDPSVQVTGLEEAGLYATNLPTTVTRTLPDGQVQSYEMTYLGDGRPNCLTYSSGDQFEIQNFKYDEAGRLSERTSDGDGSMYQYSYNEDGRIVGVADMRQTGLSRGDYSFSYDGEGRLSSFSMQTMHSDVAREYSYDGGRLGTIELSGSYSSTGGESIRNTTFSYDESGRVCGVEELSNNDIAGPLTIRDASQYAYDDAGRLVSETNSTEQYSVLLSESYAKATYDGNGFPTMVEYSLAGSVGIRTAELACNADGYVESISVLSPENDGIGGTTFEIVYVKRIGSLDDRAKEAYVPRVSIEFGLANWNGPLSDDLWFAGGGAPQYGVVFSLRDAAYIPFDSADPVPSLAACPNQLSLRAYDRGSSSSVPSVVGSVGDSKEEIMSESPEAQVQSEGLSSESIEQSEGNTPSTQEEPADALLGLDLSNAETYQGVNQFLSNFTEMNFARTSSFNSAAAPDGNVIGAFVGEHCRINKTDVVEYAPGNSYDIPGPGGGGAQGVYNVRIPESILDEVTQRYLGMTYDHAIFDDAYYCYDGWLYFGVTAPGTANGIALATSSEGVGDGSYRVSYAVYTSGMPYDPLDASLYGMSESELLARLDGGQRAYSGTAVVRPNGDGYQLVSMQTN